MSSSRSRTWARSSVGRPGTVLVRAGATLRQALVVLDGVVSEQPALGRERAVSAGHLLGAEGLARPHSTASAVGGRAHRRAGAGVRPPRARGRLRARRVRGPAARRAPPAGRNAAPCSSPPGARPHQRWPDGGPRTMRGGRPFSRKVRAAIAIAVVVDLAVLGADVFLLDNVVVHHGGDLDDALVDFRSSREPMTPVTSAPAGGAEVTAPTAPFEPSAADAAVDCRAVASAGADRERRRSRRRASSLPPRACTGTAPPAGRASRSSARTTTTRPRPTRWSGTPAAADGRSAPRWCGSTSTSATCAATRRSCSSSSRAARSSSSARATAAAFVCDPPQVQHALGDVVGATTAVDCGDGAFGGRWSATPSASVRPSSGA